MTDDHRPYHRAEAVDADAAAPPGTDRPLDPTGHPDPAGPPDPATARAEARRTWLERRRDKIRAELERNRQGGHRVPTWALAVLLIVIVVAWVALIVVA